MYFFVLRNDPIFSTPLNFKLAELSGIKLPCLMLIKSLFLGGVMHCLFWQCRLRSSNCLLQSEEHSKAYLLKLKDLYCKNLTRKKLCTASNKKLSKKTLHKSSCYSTVNKIIWKRKGRHPAALQGFRNSLFFLSQGSINFLRLHCCLPTTDFRQKQNPKSA